jgi:predicted nucleic-acid-binding protein
LIGLDTNVLLRIFIADDDRSQHERALNLMRTAEMPVFVNPIVLSEATWTLSKRFKVGRADVAGFVEKVLASSAFAVANTSAAQRALVLYRQGKADYADYLIAETNAEAGCDQTATFDRYASRHPQYFQTP